MANNDTQLITGLVNTMLGLKHCPTVTVLPDDPLIDSGLTSLDVVKLVFQVEAALNLEFPPETITPANFASIAAIAALAGRLQTRAA